MWIAEKKLFTCTKIEETGAFGYHDEFTLKSFEST
jgi:hypothetical protein